MRHTIKYFIFSLVAITAFAGCDQFVQMNENPNEPTEVSPDVLMASAIRSSMNTMVTESFLLGNNAAQLTAKTLRTEVDAYNWNAFPTVWEGLYESLTDIKSYEEIAAEDGNEKMQGTAKVLRVWIFSTITNAYGSVPYFEAIQGDEDNFTPVYDDQSDIYNDMLAELDAADQLLQGSGSIEGDLIFSGDAGKWVKLCNSLHLRLLMTANEQMADVGSQFANIANNRSIMESNDDNATLTYLGGFPNQYPLIPLKQGDFDAVALSQNAYQALDGYGDPRLMRYARPNNDDYSDTDAFSGAVNGSNSANCDKAGSRLGAPYWNDPDQTSYTDLGIGQAEGILMTYAELEFILAEAAAKGWIGDDVEAHYRNGIQASMDYYQVDFGPFTWADFNDFYDNSGVAYDSEMDIWEQKWLALFFHGLEPYFEVRRWYVALGEDWSNLPFLNAPCENLNNDDLPMRFLYPGEEQSLNSENYQAAVDEIGSNSQNAKMWLVQ